MELAAPGIKKEYCRVAINDEGNLTIAIENKQEHKHEDSHHHYLRREFIIKAPTCVCKSGPFYAVRVKPAIHHTMGGLSVNTETQVLRADGTPIGGLYAAGEVTGGLHGANRLGGNGVADIVVNGRLAGLAASKRLARSDHP